MFEAIHNQRVHVMNSVKINYLFAYYWKFLANIKAYSLKTLYIAILSQLPASLWLSGDRRPSSLLFSFIISKISVANSTRDGTIRNIASV